MIKLNKKEFFSIILDQFFDPQDYEYLKKDYTCVSYMKLNDTFQYLSHVGQNPTAPIIQWYMSTENQISHFNLLYQVSIAYDYYEKYKNLMPHLESIQRDVDKIAKDLIDRENLSKEEIILYCSNYKLIG